MEHTAGWRPREWRSALGSVVRAMALAAAVLALPASGSAEESGSEGSDESGTPLSVLSYNTHGLPTWLAGDAPSRRFPEIARRLPAYDVALLQEDFAHHTLLADGLDGQLLVRGNPSRFRACPICSGSGLTLVSALPRESWSGIEARPYGGCSGWMRRAGDCWATKGAQIARLSLPGDGSLHLVNTHLDAGRGEADRAVRRDQLDALARLVRERVGDGALVLAGDLNLRAGDPGDEALLERLRRDLGLRDSGARAAPGGAWSVLDYILYRSGPGTRLEVTDAGEDQDFRLEGEPLSDHPAIFARFRVVRAGP